MNLYILPDEVKADLPDMIQETTTKYNGVIYRRCQDVSRSIDRRCKRQFFPQMATKYFSVGGPRGAESAMGILWVPDLISVSAIAFSSDNGETYEELAVTDFILTVGEDFDKGCSYNTIILDVNGDYASFPRGQRSVKITGVWGYTDDRELCWEDSGITLAADAAEGAGSLTVADADVEDVFGAGTALMTGRLIRIGEEILLVTAVDSETNVVSVIGGRNGSSQAAHSSGDAITLWRPPYPIVDAARTMAVKDFLNSQQGYFTRGAENIGGQARYHQYMDQSVLDKLATYIRIAI